jgi:hypothetical protein
MRRGWWGRGFNIEFPKCGCPQSPNRGGFAEFVLWNIFQFQCPPKVWLIHIIHVAFRRWICCQLRGWVCFTRRVRSFDLAILFHFHRRFFSFDPSIIYQPGWRDIFFPHTYLFHFHRRVRSFDLAILFHRRVPSFVHA